MGAGWCPPGMLGIGIGGTAEKAVLMAKESLMDDLDMYELQAKSARGEKLGKVEELRLELYEKVNALGIGAHQHHHADARRRGPADAQRCALWRLC